MSEQQQFEAMLVAFMSSDNLQRKAAEEAYNQAKGNSAWLLQALLEVGTNSANVGAANMAFVLMRREFHADNEAFEKCDAETQARVKTGLVTFFGSTQDKVLRKACAGAVSNLATKLSKGDANAWPDLWELLLGAMNNASAAAEVRASSCYVFGQVATVLATTYFKSNTAALGAAVFACITAPEQAVKSAAIECLAALVQSMGEGQLTHMRICLPPIYAAINAAIGSGDSDTAKDMIGELVQVAEHQAELFKGVSKEFLGAMLHIVQTPEVESDCRHMALEAILQFGEMKPKDLRKSKPFVTELFNVLFAYIQQPTVEDDWATTYDDTKETDDTDFDAGTTGMDRLSQIVKGKVIQELATGAIMQHIGSAEWKHRVAALSTLTYIMEGCKKQFEKNLATIVNTVVIPRLDDEHPMVRYYALQCIAQFCTDFGPHFQVDYAAQILPLICAKLSDPTPRIVAIAAGTLNTFLDELEADEEDEEMTDEERKARVSEYKAFEQYADPLCRALVAALKGSSLDMIHQQCLTTLSSLIQVGGKMMSPFVGELVPMLQEVLALPDTLSGEEQSKRMQLKCRAIECTTLMACGVGKETFGPWSHAVCQYLGSVLQQGLANDDPRMRFILRGWTCMVECLGDEVLQYLPSVMPRLLAVANTDCDAEVITEEAAEKEADNDKVKLVRIAVAGEGEKTLRLHTGLIEDKDLAITIVMSIAQELKGLLKPYFTDIMNCAVNLLDFQSYAEIRDTACETLSALSAGYKAAEPEHSAAFVQHCVPKILEAVKEEPETNVAGQMLKSIGTLLENAPRDSLPAETTVSAANIIFQLFEESLKRIDELNSEKAGLEQGEDEDDEGEQLEDDAESEDWLLSECVGVVEQLIKSTTAFLPLFAETFMPLCQRLLANTMNDDQHKHALCMYADFIEHGQAACLPQVGVMAPALLHYVAAEEADAKQSAIYAAGLLGELLAKSFPQPHAESMSFVNTLMMSIGSWVATPAAATEEFRAVVDNAISTVLRCVEGFGANIDGVALLRGVLPMLPACEDRIEAERVHERLTKWIHAGHPMFAQNLDLRDAILSKLRAAKYVTAETAAVLASL